MMTYKRNSIIDSMKPIDKIKVLDEIINKIICCAFKQRRYVLILENLHWYDTKSLSVLNNISNIQNVLIVCTCRPPEEESLDVVQMKYISNLVSNSDITSLPLFREDEVRQVIMSMLNNSVLQKYPDVISNVSVRKLWSIVEACLT
jgi:predicted ATPase